MTKKFEFENLKIPQNGLFPKPYFSRPKFFFLKVNIPLSHQKSFGLVDSINTERRYTPKGFLVEQRQIVSKTSLFFCLHSLVKRPWGSLLN